MLRPLKVWQTDANGEVMRYPDGSPIALPVAEQRPLDDTELTAAGHDRYRESEKTQEDDMRLMRARAEVERDSLLRAADAIAERGKK
jgi:hypothetical protein